MLPGWLPVRFLGVITWLNRGHACTDLIPGWQDKHGDGCNEYSNRGWCSATGAYDLAWNPEFQIFFSDQLAPGETLTAADVCCRCGAGLCKDKKQWLDSRGWSCDQYYQEGWCPSGIPQGERLEDYAVDNVSAADACCHCGGGCQSSTTWVDSGGNNCSSYYRQQWCAWSGGVGPGWNSSWGTIDDYAADGMSAWDACCECSRCKDDHLFFAQDQVNSFAAQNCTVVRRIRFMLFIWDFSVLSNLRSLHMLEVIQVMATSLTGFENAVVGDIRILGSKNMPTLAGIGRAYDNIMNLIIVNMELVRDLHGLPTFSKVRRMFRIFYMPALVTMAALGHLQEVGYLSVQVNPFQTSFHGLEHVHSIIDRNWWGNSVEIKAMPTLQSLDALSGLRGSMTGSLQIELEPTNKRISAQGLLGVTQTCTLAWCVSKPVRFLVVPEPSEDSYCFPPEEASYLHSIAGLTSAGDPVIDPPSFNDGCHTCPEDCGTLSHGYRVPCDYRVGRCGCPLGTIGPNCTATPPEVRMLPGQSQECVRPRKADGDTILCEVCIAVETNAYDTNSLAPPQSLRVEEADSNSGWPWPQRITWQTPFQGNLCTNISLSAVDPPLGSQVVELFLSYSDYTQDFFLPGSLRSPLRNPIEPWYPYCLESGDCTRRGNDTVSFSLTISEPPVGRIEFSKQDLWVLEGTVSAVVVKRVGGDYGSLLTTIEVDNSSVAVQDFHYLWPGFTLSWLHGDARSKAFTVVLQDNSVAEPDVVLSLRLQQDGPNTTCKLWIQDDGDAGQLGFSDQRLVLPETSLTSGCLFHACRDGGSSGHARVRVQVVECLTQEIPADEGRDFLFVPGVLSWEDGEVGEKCAVSASNGSVGTQAVEGPAQIAVLEDASTERDETVCFGLIKLDGGAEVTTTESSIFGPTASFVLLDRGPEGGPVQAPCDRGGPCHADLSQSNLARHLAGARRLTPSAPFVTLSLGSCPLCSAPSLSAVADLNESYVASWAQLDVEPAQYLVCLCACTEGCSSTAVASLTVTGIQGGHQGTCSLGQECKLPVLQGLGLQMGDAVTVQESCGQTEHLAGLPSQVAVDHWGNGSYVFSSNKVLSGSSGLFNLCWCRPDIQGGQTCVKATDFFTQVGLFKVEGPHFGQAFECFLNTGSCILSGLAGTGMRAGDKLMAKESCKSSVAIDWGAETLVAVTADGRNYSFGRLGSGEVLQELALCWCPASAPCESPGEFRGEVGRLTLRCWEGFYWPTADGVEQPRGECQACDVYQKTVQNGSVGRAACVCRTQADGWPFQEVTDGNCGCRDGYFWKEEELSRGCVPCNEGQDCRWENRFSRSLEPPPLVPGHWSDPRGSVYRCFSTNTCPFTNSTCAAGRTGKACALCIEGFVGGHDGECQPFFTSCAQETSQASMVQIAAYAIPTMVLLISLAMVCMAQHHKKVTKEKNKHVLQTLSGLREAIAQNFQYLQILSIVSLFKVRWPPLLSEIWATIRSITTDLITIPSLGCILPHPSSFNEMLARYLIPVVVAVMTLISWLLVRLVHKGLRACPCRRAKTLRAQLKVRGIQILELLVLTGCLFYSLIVRNGFIVFTCSTGPNGVSSVVIYPHIDCPSTGADLSDWLQLLPFALTYNLIFSVGFTLLVFYAARQVAAHLVRTDFTDSGPWHFVATEFRDTYTWWLFFKMTKDLLINILAAVFTNLGSIQLLSTAVLSTIYGYLCAQHHPYRDTMNNVLEVWCALSVAAICFFSSGMGFAYDAEDDYAETALESAGLGEDGTLRAQILLSFQLISFVGGFGITFLQLVAELPGAQRWLPKSVRRREPEDIDAAKEQLQVAFKAADFSKYDAVAVIRNFALLQESRALLHATEWHMQRTGSLARLMPGRHYMAQLIKKESDLSRHLDDDSDDGELSGPQNQGVALSDDEAMPTPEQAGNNESCEYETVRF